MFPQMPSQMLQPMPMQQVPPMLMQQPKKLKRKQQKMQMVPQMMPPPPECVCPVYDPIPNVAPPMFRHPGPVMRVL
jgi:hypothetical protein